MMDREPRVMRELVARHSLQNQEPWDFFPVATLGLLRFLNHPKERHLLEIKPSAQTVGDISQSKHIK